MCVYDRDISEKPTPPSSLLHSHCLFFNPSSPSVLDKIDHYHWKNGEIRDKNMEIQSEKSVIRIPE